GLTLRISNNTEHIFTYSHLVGVFFELQTRNRFGNWSVVQRKPSSWDPGPAFSLSYLHPNSYMEVPISFELYYPLPDGQYRITHLSIFFPKYPFESLPVDIRFSLP
ncbi:MAG: hypothetical protein FWC89_05090, partial [Defluviitaleaceae bacterium]|nr:hypothetical protein [Defluviitaleaceae bacterium]